ncbi:MAG: hypothetical protein APF80_11795 [Alphaproteobacteria bacterium BRH_c36]|nr:MAG: hypothetical protein APF80_11795 [Alphaproteobacteria bacterium BRH_c36]
MTSTFKKLFATALTVAIVAGASTNAFAVSNAVKYACMGDYLSYCSGHAPGSAGVKQCMRANGSKLSKGCVGALVKAGMVSQSEVSRRAASLGR